MAIDPRVSAANISPTRNYLTLIIVLVVLACAAAALSLVLTGQSLSDGQKWFLLVFLTLFPIIGLSVSSWLIVGHFRKLNVAQKDEDLKWTLMTPEQQRRRLNGEVSALAALLGSDEYSINDLRSAYIVAEDLAIRQVEIELKQSLIRHVFIEGSTFDAICLRKDIVYLADVTFLVTPEFSKEKLGNILNKTENQIKAVRRLRPKSRVRLLLIIITQLEPAETTALKNSLTKLFSTTTIDADIKFYDYDTLQLTFASEY